MSILVIPHMTATGGGTCQADAAGTANAIMMRDGSGNTAVAGITASTGINSAGYLYEGYQAHTAGFTLDDATNKAVVHGMDTSSGDLTVTLPAAASFSGRVLIVVKTSSDANRVIIDANSTELISGTLQAALYRQYDRIHLVCDGTGWVIIDKPVVIANAVAASTAVSNTTSATAFDNFAPSFVANTLRAGDVLEFFGQVNATATNSTDTLTVKLLSGSTVIVSTGALDVANADIAVIHARLVVRTVGASGTLVASGWAAIGTAGATGAIGALTAKPFFLASVTLDTTAAAALTCTATWSVASSSNSCRLDVATLLKHAA